MGAGVQGISVERSLGVNGGFGEEVQEEVLGFFALAASGFEEAAQDAMVFQTFVGARALDDPAHDDHGAQTALGLIVGRGDVGTAKAGEEKFLFLAQETLAKALGAGMAQGFLTELIELGTQALAFGFGLLGPPGLLGELAVRLAGSVNQRLHVLAELTGQGLGIAALEQG